MADNTNKVTIGEEPITVPAAQFSRILRAAVHCEYLMEQKRILETRIANMRRELASNHDAFAKAKTSSGAGASVEPQKTTTDADESKTDAGALAIEAEGRVSGGKRAELEALRKERDELKRNLEMKEEQCKECAALCAAKMQCDELGKERDELKARLESKCVGCNRAVDATANELRLAAAEGCIDEIENAVKLVMDDCIEEQVVEIVRAWRENREAK